MSNESLAKKVVWLLFDLRSNMTSVTRYVRHNRQDHPGLTDGQFLDRNLEYKELALKATDNILRLLNKNEELDALLKEALSEEQPPAVPQEDQAECPAALEVAEMCPHCSHENIYQNWDVKERGYVAVCSSCKKQIFLCSECVDSEDGQNPDCNYCDWRRTSCGHECFRGAIFDPDQ